LEPFVFLGQLGDVLMAQKPTYKELEKRVKELEKEVAKRKLEEDALRESTRQLQLAHDQPIVYAQGLNEEATERKQEDEALRESEEKYSALVENSLTGIFIHQDGKYVFVNERFADIHGYQPEELLGRDPLTLIHPDERDALRQLLSKRLKGEDAPDRYEIRRLRKDGKAIWCEMMATRIEYAKRPAIMGNVIDITERKRTQEALRKAHDELEQRVKERTVELAKINEELLEYDHIVAHVLKAPLRAIHYYSDFLREELEGNLKGNQKTYLDSLTRAVRQAAGLVDDLLEFSTVGRRSGPVERIDIGAFLYELIESLDLPSDVEVVMGNEWPSIKAEPTLLQAIFSHLIRNAVKFNHLPHKRVELGWLPAGNERYELFVRDNGIGIEPRYHEQIFHIFERLHTDKEYEGTGVGLAICKKIVERHGGRIWVDSEPGKGSIFYFTIPRAG
jgi:PAS domain S-box-containing protein